MKKYTNYKQTGIDWIGEIPEHWDFKKLKWILRKGNEGIKIGPFGSMLKLVDLDPNGEYKVYGQSNVIRSDFTHGDKTINKDKFNELSQYEIKAGDMVITMMGSAGYAMVVPVIQAGIMDSHLTRIRIKDDYLIQFIELLINDSHYVITQRVRDSKGSIMAGLNSSILKDLLLLLPPKIEQVKITGYLRHKITLIDNLISKNNLLIQLLEEKKQATINQAVTKGLDPNVKLKNSGIEWIGEIPEHWSTPQLKYIFDIKAGGDLNMRYFSEQRTETHCYPIYTNATDPEAVYGYTSKPFYEANTITVTGRGDIGRAIFRNHEYDAIIRLLVLTPRKDDLSKFFTYQINSTIDFSVNKSAISQLSTVQISPYKIAVPPVEEQQEITEYLDRIISKFNQITISLNKQNALLQEYRQALISNAVTGKIDVRDEPIPEKFIKDQTL